MTRPRLSNYLRTKRLRSGLTQRELGELLGVSHGTICKAEGERSPTIALLVAAEIVFGTSHRELFPGISAYLDRGLAARAETLLERLSAKEDPVSRRKRAFLGELLQRAHINDCEL